MVAPSLWLIRADFRLADNPALTHAAATGPVVPVFVLNTGARKLGGASCWLLHHLLEGLGRQIPLVILRGDLQHVVPALAQRLGAAHVFWNAEGLPDEDTGDNLLCEALHAVGAQGHISAAGNLLHTPATFRTLAGGYYKVFTPFWKALSTHGWPAPLPAPQVLWHTGVSGGLDIGHLKLLPTAPNWAARWTTLWPLLAEGTEAAAQRQLQHFLGHSLKGYATLRDRPDLEATSGLSPALQWGLVSPRQVAAAVQAAAAAAPALQDDAAKFLAELGWREFSRHLLWHFPALPTRNWKSTFDAYPWVDPQSPTGQAHFEAWTQGQTGYPLVDAGMRQLWQTGTLPNRVRMVAASFLVKHLRLPWQLGEEWFWDTLLDASPASNAASWQWVAGCGADAAPYFRIFNPTGQAEKFDPSGTYIHTWCPELRHLAPPQIFTPGMLAPAYPAPLVDHARARALALDGYQRMSL